jgi:hypothetical protein
MVLTGSCTFSPTCEKKVRAEALSIEEEQCVVCRSVVIQRKDCDSICVGSQRYKVNDSTEILSLTMKRIALSDLPTPCEAEVEILVGKDEQPICRKVEVLRLLDDPESG